MKNSLLVISLFVAGLLPLSLQAASESQLAAISAIGELNGIALQCKFIEQTRRIKTALVLNLPQKRQLGEWFDLNTNMSFMAFINNQSSCPVDQVFKTQVNAAIGRIESEFQK